MGLEKNQKTPLKIFNLCPFFAVKIVIYIKGYLSDKMQIFADFGASFVYNDYNKSFSEI